MKSVPHETIRRSMSARLEGRYHDAAIKAARERGANAKTGTSERPIVKFFSAPMLVIDANSETGLGVSCTVVAG